MEICHDGVSHETDDAVLFYFDERDVWIPKSVINDYDGLVVEVESWFAEKEELEGYMS